MAEVVKASAGRVGRGKRERLTLAAKVVVGVFVTVVFFAAIALEILRSICTRVLKSGWQPPGYMFAVYLAAVVAIVFAVPCIVLALRQPAAVRVFSMEGAQVRKWQGSADA